jgi:hypothetical protein
LDTQDQLIKSGVLIKFNPPPPAGPRETRNRKAAFPFPLSAFPLPALRSRSGEGGPALRFLLSAFCFFPRPTQTILQKTVSR